MEEVRTTGTYREFKESLDRDIRQQTEGFVRIGYKLKVARDTEILGESGYKTVAEFAKAEYGFPPDVVSRFIDINDRYSEGGYSETLKTEFRGYGYTKLAEMLTLPDSVIRNLDPKMSREKIREVKREIEGEKKITDLEVLMEGQQPEQEALTMEQKAMHQYFYEHREAFTELASVLGNAEYCETDPEAIMDVIAPSGMAAVSVRVQGIGKMMMFFRGVESDIDIQNVRTLENVRLNWTQFAYQIKAIYRGLDFSDPEKAWEEAYHEPFSLREEKPAEKATELAVPVREKKEIAPAQKSAGVGAEKKEKLSKPQAAVPEAKEHPSMPEPQKPEEEQQEEPTAGPQPEVHEEEQQIPGQDTILNHPEILPPKYQTEVKVEGETVTGEVEPSNAHKKACEELIAVVQGNFEMGNYTAALKWARKLCGLLEEMVTC